MYSLVRIPSTDFTSIYPLIQEYAINPTVPGVALIINVQDFSALSEVGGPRLGSHVDVDRLEALFQWLHFKTIVPKNQDGSQSACTFGPCDLSYSITNLDHSVNGDRGIEL